MAVDGKFSLAGKRVWVAGHRGMVGSAITRRLASEGCEMVSASRSELDLKDQARTRAWVEQARPDAIFLAAGTVGGILANATYPADFLYDNLMIEGNVIEAAYRSGVSKVLFLGSSCIYPKMAAQPIVEESLLTGPLEPTNEWYAVAKIAGIKLAQAYRQQHGCDFISAMPTNLYGPNDNFDLVSSHVLPAIMRKAHAAKVSGSRELVIWGSGKVLREFLHADDCADALVFLMQNYSDTEHVNVGSGKDLTIGDLARLIAEVVGFEGELVFDSSKPDGTPRKLMSGDRIKAMGWAPSIGLRDGVERTYQWFRANAADVSEMAA